MRLFVGIEFPSAVLDKLAGYQAALRKSGASGRFKRRDNFHLTLKFLGEIPAEKIAELTDQLTASTATFRPFSLKLGQLGRFGQGEVTRVLWLDVAGETGQLKSLQANVEKELAQLGFKSDRRPWQPHITLAQDVRLAASLPWGQCPLPQVSFAVTEFALVLSEEIDRKRVYTPIHTFPLRGE